MRSATIPGNPAAMRILHIVVGLDPALGGLPAVAARLAASQAQAGHHVTLVTHASPQRASAVEQSIRGIPGIERVRIVGLDPAVRAGWFISPAALEALCKAIGEAEIVHLHGLWEPLVRQAATEAWRTRRLYILTPHGMLDPWSLRQRWLKKKVALLLVFRRVLQRAARLHLLNADEVQLLRPLGLTTRTVVIPNGVFLEEIEPLPPSGTFRSAHRELGSDPYILFLSRLHHKKGLDHLAAAFGAIAKQRPDVRLVVAGPDGGAQADFDRRVRDAGVQARVHVVGPLWGRDKFAAMVDAACFCLPSRQEGFSMAITEAMACGLPVVISEACHFPEVGEVGAGEIVPLQDDAIAAALERVLTDAGAAERMGAAGRRLVLQRYAWPVIGERAVQAYAEVLAERA
jgi:glycosyltransferase involved in cell wall biosynthesis